MDPRVRGASTNVDFERFQPGTLTWVSPAAAPAAEDRLVTAAFRFLMKDGLLDATSARSLGRALGAQAGPDMMGGYLEAFSHLGVGCLRLHADEAVRFRFESRDLLGSERPGSRTCALALGFTEGLVGAVLGQPAMGAELTCRARGAEACTFVVMPRK